MRRLKITQNGHYLCLEVVLYDDDGDGDGDDGVGGNNDRLPVDEFSADAALEKAAAAVARQNAVVFAARSVPAHETRQAGRASLHQCRRQPGVDRASTGADRRSSSNRGCCRHGRLVQHHPVNHCG